MTTAELPAAAASDGATTWSRLAVPGMASIGAGAIHAAAIGVHSEHRQAVLAFALLAAFQLGWGALALTRTGPATAVVGAVGNLVAVGGWVLAKTSGISFVDGLDVAEGIQFADATAAALALAAAVGAVALQFGAARRRQSMGSAWTSIVAGVAVAVLALTVPAMVSAGSHHHAEGETGHDHGGAEVAAGGHAHGEETASTSAVVPPNPYDPTKPIDLSGVAGVTPEQQARAENLIAVTLARLPKYADTNTAYAAGYRTIQDAATGYEHYINWSYLDDGKILDPDYPDSLVYRAYRDGRRELQAAMFMLTPNDTLDTVPDLGGALTQWHIHDNLCFGPNGTVAGLTRGDGTCAPPLVKPEAVPMIHVWIVPNRCGPFAALDGIAGGQVKPGESKLCDTAHGGHA